MLAPFRSTSLANRSHKRSLPGRACHLGSTFVSAACGRSRRPWCTERRKAFASTPGEIDAAFAAFAREKPDALFIGGDSYFVARQTQLATLAVRDRLPASGTPRDMAQAGLLMSYGVSDDDAFGQVGVYTGRILKGAKPADLPVLQATKFEFVINLQTAKSLGLDVPPTVLPRADDVIE